MTGAGEPPKYPKTFADAVATIGPISFEGEVGVFEDTIRRQRALWQESGLLGRLVDVMPVLDGDREVCLSRDLRRVRGSSPLQLIYFRVNHETSTTDPVTGERSNVSGSTSAFEVVRLARNVRQVMSPFSPGDADLVISHIVELEQLRDQGILPHLSANCSSLIDPETMLGVRPQQA